MPTTTRSQHKLELPAKEVELRSAVYRRDIDRVHDLVIVELVPPDCADEHGITPMAIALTNQDLVIGRFLLDNRASAHGPYGSTGVTLLAAAIVLGLPGFVELLIRYHTNIDLHCGGLAPLGHAIGGGDTGMVQLLLEHGASTKNVLLEPGVAVDAMHVAIFKKNQDIMENLLVHGEDVNSIATMMIGETRGKFTPLCIACVMGDPEIAKKLLQKLAKVLFAGFADEVLHHPSPLLHAISNGSNRVLRLLLENISNGWNSGEWSEMQKGVAGHLGGFLMKEAIRMGRFEAAQQLLGFGANVNEQPIVAWCAKNGNVEGARFLLRAGANKNRVDDRGRTALWIAAYKGDVEMVKELLKAQANTHIRDHRHGETPLGIAHRKGHTGIVFLLLSTSPHVWPALKRPLAE